MGKRSFPPNTPHARQRPVWRSCTCKRQSRIADAVFPAQWVSFA